jgi:hypothetical protein
MNDSHYEQFCELSQQDQYQVIHGFEVILDLDHHEIAIYRKAEEEYNEPLFHIYSNLFQDWYETVKDGHLIDHGFTQRMKELHNRTDIHPFLITVLVHLSSSDL